ncbi:MAG: Holliday junction resolvase RuvX [Oscillospiraceae bacterium]|nr:Holliday junction resolvase RuvX [Oscillospiraceae bacterium]
MIHEKTHFIDYCYMRILAVDYGEARTGLAVSDYTGTIATPMSVIHEKGFNKLIEKIVEAVKENEVGEVVVGNPLNMDGTVGEKSRKCERLAERLRVELAGIPVVMSDERLTTVEAYSIVSQHRKRSNRRKSIDAVAAAVILEEYLDSVKNK